MVQLTTEVIFDHITKKGKMKKSTKQQVLIPGDRVKIKREEGDMDSED